MDTEPLKHLRLRDSFTLRRKVCVQASALSSLHFGVRPKLCDAQRRRNHDAERRASKFANPRL